MMDLCFALTACRVARARAGDGIFVKPKERIEIVSAVVMHADGQGGLVLDEGEKRKVEL